MGKMQLCRVLVTNQMVAVAGHFIVVIVSAPRLSDSIFYSQILAMLRFELKTAELIENAFESIPIHPQLCVDTNLTAVWTSQEASFIYKAPC